MKISEAMLMSRSHTRQKYQMPLYAKVNHCMHEFYFTEIWAEQNLEARTGPKFLFTWAAK